jgi:hypothetical protein
MFRFWCIHTHSSYLLLTYLSSNLCSWFLCDSFIWTNLHPTEKVIKLIAIKNTITYMVVTCKPTACVVLTIKETIALWYYQITGYYLWGTSIKQIIAYVVLPCSWTMHIQIFSTHESNLKMHTSVSVKFMEELYGMLFYNSSQYS